MTMQKPVLLVLVFLSEEHRALFANEYEVIYAPYEKHGNDRSYAVDIIRSHAADIRFVLTNGAHGITADEIHAMPHLEFINTLGVGFEKVDLAAARARGIVVCNTAGSNAEAVADHAMMLLLAAIRRLPFLNREVRHGLWRDDIPRPPHISHRKMGIFGMGAIGEKLARRALGFEMQVGYHSRTRKDHLGYQWFDDLASLAEWCDDLIVCAPGGQETFHIINQSILEKLGPGGVLVNVARGSIVDTAALSDALKHNRIWAAALDVWENEPAAPTALVAFDQAVITPHIAGISPEAINANVGRVVDNLRLHRAGKPPISPI